MKKHMPNIIISNTGILSGTPVFQGTRVPVQTLLDYLEADDSIETFFDDFPTVTHEQAVAVLEVAKEKLLATV